jgi:hypothetical protein
VNTSDNIGIEIPVNLAHVCFWDQLDAGSAYALLVFPGAELPEMKYVPDLGVGILIRLRGVWFLVYSLCSGISWKK